MTRARRKPKSDSAQFRKQPEYLRLREQEAFERRVKLARKRGEKTFEHFGEMYALKDGMYIPWYRWGKASKRVGL